MTYKTHLIGGAQVGAVLVYLNQGTPAESAALMGAALFGSILPDIDYTKSKIAKSDSLVGLLSFALSRVTKHRGFTHSLLGAALMAVIFYGLSVYKTEAESLAAMTAAAAVFIIIHAAGGFLRFSAGWAAAAVYTMGPQIADLFMRHNIEFTLNTGTARLCAIGIFAGCVIHMVYDTFNSGGIPWLYPLTGKNFKLAAIKTRSTTEGVFAMVQMVILSLLIIACFLNTDVLTQIKEALDALRR